MPFVAGDVTALTPAFNVGRRRRISFAADAPWSRVPTAPNLPEGTPKLDSLLPLLPAVSTPLVAILDVDVLLGHADAERLLGISDDGAIALLSGHPDLMGFVLGPTDVVGAAVRDVTQHFPNPYWGGEDLLLRAALYSAGLAFRATYWADTLVLAHSPAVRRRPSGVHFAAHAHAVNQRAYSLAASRYGLDPASVAGLALLHPSCSSFSVERKSTHATTLR